MGSLSSGWFDGQSVSKMMDLCLVSPVLFTISAVFFFFCFYCLTSRSRKVFIWYFIWAIALVHIIWLAFNIFTNIILDYERHLLHERRIPILSNEKKSANSRAAIAKGSFQSLVESPSTMVSPCNEKIRHIRSLVLISWNGVLWCSYAFARVFITKWTMHRCEGMSSSQLYLTVGR